MPDSGPNLGGMQITSESEGRSRSIASFAWAFTESMSTTRRPATSAGGSERSTVSNESTEVATTTTSHASAANASRVRQKLAPIAAASAE